MRDEKELIQLILDTDVLDIDSKKEIILEIVRQQNYRYPLYYPWTVTEPSDIRPSYERNDFYYTTHGTGVSPLTNTGTTNG